MLPSLILATSLFVLPGAVSAYSTNYTSQLLSSQADLGDWQAAYEKAKTVVAGLNTTEKVSVITGTSVSAFDALEFKDSGNSILAYYYATTWPVGHAAAFTWDKDLMYQQYNALGKEFYNKGLQVVNAPLAEPIGRTPWGGRNAEAYGPDSYLNGIAFGIATKAISDAGVIPAGKHFLLNEQETNRESQGGGGMSGGTVVSESYSSDADDKTLHETYLWPFYDAVKNGLGGVMCAMNRVNETYSCENQELLGGKLKTELAFPGFVYADVSGQKTVFGSANAGMDFGSSSDWSTTTIQAGLTNGSLTTDRLDDMAIRNIIPYYKAGMDSGDQPSFVSQTVYRDARKGHAAIARKVAADSLVVLKNTNNALPLKAPKSVSIFGAHAGPVMGGPNTQMDVQGQTSDVFNGHNAQVPGSGQGSFSYLVTPHQALTIKAMEDGTMLRWILNDTWSSGSLNQHGVGNSFYQGTAAAITYDSYASNSEVCIVFLNTNSGEGGDRGELRNDDQDTLVETVASECNNTMVVINASGQRLVDQWIENENVTALVYGSMLGQESGNAIVDILYGDVVPSGKLAYTIAKNESDYPVEICETTVCNFTEGNYIDYKHFDKYNITPRYEFGFGLSYTTFEYGTNLTVMKTNSTGLSETYPTGVHSVGGQTDLWEIVAKASIDIKNNGTLDGAEVAQLYVKYPDSADEPAYQLRAFDKVNITAGSSATASFELRRRDLSIWDVAAQKWAVVKGTYTFYVGSSSRNFKASATLTI